MFLHWQPKQNQRQGFTLGEILVSFCVLGMVMSGLMYGYVQIDRMAEFNSMSLAAERTDFLPGEKLAPVYLRETSFVKAPLSRMRSAGL